MQIAVGTFNLNNLFSRFDFRADVSTTPASTVKVEERTSFSFEDPSGFKLRTYLGKLVKGKLAAERDQIAERIKRMDLDVLAVQEVEDIDTQRQSARDDLGGLYPHVVLIERNDPRLIDIGLVSKLPLGGFTSWQHVPDPLNPGERVFSRDLLQVEILSRSRPLRPLQYTRPRCRAGGGERSGGGSARSRLKIIAAEPRPNSRFLVVGDMNDPPDSPSSRPLPLRRSSTSSSDSPSRRAPSSSLP